jgi:pyridoxine 5-phosphate synthase
MERTHQAPTRRQQSGVIHLGVNIDHVATLRQARYRPGPGGTSTYGEPDAVHAAAAAVLGGADSITVHLREDRRHIIDRDVEILRQTVPVKFNLEMAGTPEMQQIALRLKVHQVTLVPEGRQEVTTEGGLAVADRVEHWKKYLATLKNAGILTSAFVTPDLAQARAAADAGFDAIELHTGAFAHAFASGSRDPHRDPSLRRSLDAVLACTGELASVLRIHAGHALNYENTPVLIREAGFGRHVRELHIGHAIVARAVFVGLRQAVHEMKTLIQSSAAGIR